MNVLRIASPGNSSAEQPAGVSELCFSVPPSATRMHSAREAIRHALLVVAVVAAGSGFIPALATAAVMSGSPGNDRLVGTDRADLMSGLAGNDLIEARGGDDYALGGTGNDLLDGGNGLDRLAGQSGNDHLLGGPGTDWAYGGAGHDVVDGGPGDDWLPGGTGDDLVLARAGADLLFGGPGDDALWGKQHEPSRLADPRDDVLWAGPGDDDVHAVDNQVDLILCDSGRDTADIDLVDLVVDATTDNPNGSCEQVRRRAYDPKAVDEPPTRWPRHDSPGGLAG